MRSISFPSLPSPQLCPAEHVVHGTLSCQPLGDQGPVLRKEPRHLLILRIGKVLVCRCFEINKNYLCSFLVSQTINNLPATQETWVWSLGWEDPLEKGMATHSSILAWRIPIKEPGGRLFMGESDTTERLSPAHENYLYLQYCFFRRKCLLA